MPINSDAKRDAKHKIAIVAALGNGLAGCGAGGGGGGGL
jgi:hypothetical protein